MAQAALSKCYSTQMLLRSCVLYTARCKLIDPNGSDLPLTSMEYELLEKFLASPNCVLSREYLLEISINSVMILLIVALIRIFPEYAKK